MAQTDDLETFPPLSDGFELGVLLRSAFFALRRCANSYFDEFEANSDQFVLLKLLSEHGPLNQLDLVRHGGYDPSTTTSMLKQLEKRGHITRDADPNDGRAKIVRLTASGRAQHKKLWKASTVARKELWKCIRPQDRQIIGETLQRITVEMEHVREKQEMTRR